MLSLRQRNMCSVWLGSERVVAAHGIETPYQFGIGVPGFGCRDLVDAIAVPQPSGASEGGQSTFRRNPCASKDEEPVMRGQDHGESESANWPTRRVQAC